MKKTDRGRCTGCRQGIQTAQCMGNRMPAVEMAAHAPPHLPCSKRNINQNVKEETTKKDALSSNSSAGLLSDGHKPSALLLAERLGV